MYNEKVMNAFKNPQNVGEIENPSGFGKVGNASCGDIMQITLKIEDNVTCDNSLHPLNTPSPMLVTEFGSIISVI